MLVGCLEVEQFLVLLGVAERFLDRLHRQIQVPCRYFVGPRIGFHGADHLAHRHIPALEVQLSSPRVSAHDEMLPARSSDFFGLVAVGFKRRRCGSEAAFDDLKTVAEFVDLGGQVALFQFGRHWRLYLQGRTGTGRHCGVDWVNLRKRTKLSRSHQPHSPYQHAGDLPSEGVHEKGSGATVLVRLRWEKCISGFVQ